MPKIGAPFCDSISLVSIQKVIMDTNKFPVQKREIFYKFKETGNPHRRCGTESHEVCEEIKVLDGDVQ